VTVVNPPADFSVLSLHSASAVIYFKVRIAIAMNAI
jgi:hypothetical protein